MLEPLLMQVIDSMLIRMKVVCSSERLGPTHVRVLLSAFLGVLVVLVPASHQGHHVKVELFYLTTTVTLEQPPPPLPGLAVQKNRPCEARPGGGRGAAHPGSSPIWGAPCDAPRRPAPLGRRTSQGNPRKEQYLSTTKKCVPNTAVVTVIIFL